MSLTVPSDLLEKAQQGPVADDEFIDCIRVSLPYAWGMVERLANEMEATGSPSVQNLEVPPDDASWGEVFRLVGSDAMRGAVQRHYGVRLAFQNCCKVGYWKDALDAAGVPSARYENGMHELRHFFASALLDQGESIKAVAEWLGHADPAFTLATYTHLMPNSDERTMSAIAGIYARRGGSDGPATAQEDGQGT